MRPFAGHFIPLFLFAVLLVAGLSWAEEGTSQPAPTAEERAVAEVDRLLAEQNWQAAAEAAVTLTNETNPVAIRLAGFERLAVALAGVGDAGESERAATQAESLFHTIRFVEGQDGNTVVTVTYTVTPGGSASDSSTLFVPTWTPGDPIICEGILSPEDQAVFAAGAEVPLSIDPPTDADIRTAASSETYSDDCVVTWTASAGTFKNGVNTGNSVIWIAPDTGQAVTISATVADKAEVPPREKGARDDADYTDSITVLVCDLSVTIPSIVSVNQSAIPVQATLMAGSTPVSGRSVTFSSSDLSFSSSTAVTDASGVATVTATASANPSSALDSSSVTASYQSATATAYFTIVRVDYTGASRDSVIVGGYDIDSLYSSLLTFRVTPAIAGVPLTFSFESGEGEGDLIPAALESPSSSTDSYGVGTVRIRSGDLRETPTVRCTYKASTATKDIAFTGITGVSSGD